MIILTTLVTCSVVGVGTYRASQTYSASTTLRVIASAQSGSIDYVDYKYAERLMNTYVEILRSSPILEEAIQRLELSMIPKDLARKIKGEVLTDTELIRITVEDSNPQRAMDIANTLAALLMEQSESLYSGGGKSTRQILEDQLKLMESELERDRVSLQSLMNSPASAQGEIDALQKKITLEEETYAMLLRQYEQARVAEAMRASSLTVVEPAIEPEAPSKPQRKLDIMLGALVGLGVGTALGFLFDNLDTTLYTMEQVRTITGLPILGKIPAVKIDRLRGQERIALYTTGYSPQAEAYRLLRTNISSRNCESPLKTLLITSAERGEGKTTVVANLAQALAQAGHEVVAIDADLRLPALHHVFELPNEVGLSSILERRAHLEEALKTTGIPRLKVLTSGPLPANPTELLAAPQMAALLDQLVQGFDIVLLDMPSLLAVADAVVLASLVDGVALVVKLAQARRETVQAALEQLDAIHVRPVGLIVNRAQQSGQYYPRKRPGEETR